MCPDKKLKRYCKKYGFDLNQSCNRVTVTNVQYLTQSGDIGRCKIIIKKDELTGKAMGVERMAEHCAEINLLTPADKNGRLYEANGQEMGAVVKGNEKDYCVLSIKSKKNDSETAEEAIYRYIKHIVGAVIAKTNNAQIWKEHDEVFKILNTFEGRAGVRMLQDKVRNQKIAIFGLGGTGSYILDLMSKTPVSEIHLIDDDKVHWHNLMRGPGGPTIKDKEEIANGMLQKGEYLCRKYRELRHGIVVHNSRASEQMIAKLAQAGVEIAFVSVDQQGGKRQDDLYESLQKHGIKFIDSGISLRNNGDQIDGSVKLFSSVQDPKRWRESIPNARVNGGESIYKNTQLVEINALAAALAVIKWRKITEQFVESDEGKEQRSVLVYRIGQSKLIKG